LFFLSFSRSFFFSLVAFSNVFDSERDTPQALGYLMDHSLERLQQWDKCIIEATNSFE
jgi:hypothetical protein